MMKHTYPTDTIAAIISVMALLALCIMHLGLDALDLAFSTRCLSYYWMNRTEDSLPLSQFEQVMCILG